MSKINARLWGLIVIVGLFVLSVVERLKWFGVLSETGHQWITSTSLKFLQSWYAEGAWRLRFFLLENPASIEFGSGAESYFLRNVYVSYPQGAFLLPYWFCWLLGIEPSLELLTVWNLTNQLVVAVLLYDIMRILLRPERKIDWMFSVLPAACYILWPGTMYWHHSTYFSDQAAIFWLVGIVWWMLKSAECPKVPAFLKHSVTFTFVFFLTYTDWVGPVAAVFIFVAAFVLERGGVFEKIRRQVALLLASAFSLALFAGYVWQSRKGEYLLQKALQRAAVSSEGEIPLLEFAKKFVSNMGSLEALILLVASILWARLCLSAVVEDRIRKQLGLIGFTLLLPCLVTMFLLRNFTYHHSFSSLKLLPFIFLVGFGIAPALLHGDQVRRRVFGFLVIVLFVHHTQFSHRFLDWMPDAHFYRALGKLVKYEDVLVSDSLEIPENPPQAVSLSRKRLYKMATESDFQELRALVARNSPGESARYILALREESPCRGLLSPARWGDGVELPDHVYLYVFPKDEVSWPCR